MTSIQIITLIAICAGFGVFAAVLFWGDYQTRDLDQKRQAGQSRKLMQVVVARAPTAPAVHDEATADPNRSRPPSEQAA